MNSIQASCPSCDTVLTIDRAWTISVVCTRCQAVLERKGNELRRAGTGVVVIPTRAPFSLGAEGTYQGTRFIVTGQVQLGNEDSANWDEFYLGFDDGQCGWLAHAQGRLLLSFPSTLPPATYLPSFDALRLNEAVPLMPGLPALHVIEKGKAHVQAARGQVPYLITVGEVYPFADFATLDGAFASVDYSIDPPTVYVGREVTPDELGLQLDLGTRPDGTATGAMLCTECGGAIEVRNPGRSERVTCLQCRTIFDILLKKPLYVGKQEEASVKPFVPLGSVGHFPEGDLTLIGYLRRSTTDEEGKTWYWDEYLLDNGQGGYRWLIHSDNHWNLFEQIVGGGEVKPVVTRKGRNYKLFQHGPARVEYLAGEFYWNVNTGQVTDTADFVCPPYALAVEFSAEGTNKCEAVWTHGIYLPVAEVERAFGASALPRPTTVGPNQPFSTGNLYRYWLLACLVAVLVYFALTHVIRPETIFEKRFPIQPPGAEQVEKETIEIQGGRNIRITARADIQSTWLHLTGNIIDEDTLLVQPFEIPVEHWSGVENGEAWQEGSKEQSIYLSALPPGRYILAIDVERDPNLKTPAVVAPGQHPPVASWFEVRVEQGRPRLMHLIVVLVVLSVVPLITWLVQRSFESRRWQGSNATPTS